MEQREEDVRELITDVPGFVSTDESPNRAAAWVKENVGVSVDPPEIVEGSTFIQF